jgi:hypothetical protein
LRHLVSSNPRSANATSGRMWQQVEWARSVSQQYVHVDYDLFLPSADGFGGRRSMNRIRSFSIRF